MDFLNLDAGTPHEAEESQFHASAAPSNSPILVAAFSGWNDAGEAATGVIRHLVAEWDARPIAVIDGPEYYDYQVHRPHVGFNGKGEREIAWPTTRIYTCSPLGSAHDIILVHGLEPNMRWREFCDDMIELHQAFHVETSVLLGSLLSDTPHTHPTPITGNATDDALLEKYNLERSTYVGPTGIVGVLQEIYSTANIQSISFWAQVPHYVSHSPCPKATLSLLHRLEEVLDVRMPLGELAEEAAEWENAIADALEEDPDMAEYIRHLEESDDEPQPRPPSGDELAKMFEKYLRRGGPPV